MINKALVPYNETKVRAYDITSYTNDDIEYYLLAAYRNVSFENGVAPDFFDIYDAVQDQINMSGKNTFMFQNHILSRYELTMEMIEFVLTSSRIQFMGMKGEHVNDAQNTLVEEMIL